MTMSSAVSKLARLSRPFTVLVEGNIGAGKSLFLDRFNAFPNLQVLKEPVDKWRNLNGQNLLQLMYEDPVRWSLTFQTYVQLTMLEQHMSCVSPIKLMERSIFSAKYCFVQNLRNEGKMAESEYEVLTAWFDFLRSSSEINLEADLVVYLRTSPQVAYERLKGRNRGEEQFIPLKYIQDLHALHEDWLIGKQAPIPAPVYVIDADKDHKDLDCEFLELKKFISHKNQSGKSVSNNSDHENYRQQNL